MIRCLIIDDEPLALKQLESYVGRTPFLELASACVSATDARKYLESYSVDWMITDINMPDCNGLDFVRELKEPPLVVFSSAYEEYALEGYKVDAVDYLLKPYSYQDFLHVALKVKRILEWKQAGETGMDSDDSNDYFFVRADNKSVKIRVDEILYVEAMSEYIRIHIKNAKAVVTYNSIKVMAEILPSSRFMRIHRSYIISLENIVRVSKAGVELTGGIELPVSASYKNELMQYVQTRSVNS